MLDVLIGTVIVMAATFVIETAVTWFTKRGPLHPPSEEILTIRENLADESLLTERDREMIEESRECMARTVGDPAAETLSRMTAQQRKEASDRLIMELCQIYNVSLSGIEYVSIDGSQCGGYSINDKKLTLNVRYLLSDDVDCIREYLDTVFHEMKHAVQFSVLEGNETWQVPEERQRMWHENAMNYIRPEIDPHGYAMQPLERDASNYAYFVMRGEYQ